MNELCLLQMNISDTAHAETFVIVTKPFSRLVLYIYQGFFQGFFRGGALGFGLPRPWICWKFYFTCKSIQAFI